MRSVLSRMYVTDSNLVDMDDDVDCSFFCLPCSSGFWGWSPRLSLSSFFCRVPQVSLGLWVRSGGRLSSRDIRATSPGFLWDMDLGVTDVAPCCWEHRLQRTSSRWSFSVIAHVSSIRVGESGRLTRVLQRCWHRAELGHPGLPIGRRSIPPGASAERYAWL